MNSLYSCKLSIKSVVSVTRRRRREDAKFPAARFFSAFPNTKAQLLSAKQNVENTSPSDSSRWLSEYESGTEMDSQKVYRYLRLESFTQAELQSRFKAIAAADTGVVDNEGDATRTYDAKKITERQLQAYVLGTIEQIEEGNGFVSNYDAEMTQRVREEFSSNESNQVWNFLQKKRGENQLPLEMTEEIFVSRILSSAQTVDVKRIWPLTLSMIMVGSTVGVTTPAMVRSILGGLSTLFSCIGVSFLIESCDPRQPFVVQNLGLSAGEYGLVVR